MSDHYAKNMNINYKMIVSVVVFFAVTTSLRVILVVHNNYPT